MKTPFLRSGLTAGDALEAVGVFAVTALYVWIARSALAGGGGAPVLVVFAAATYAFGHGIHLAANSLHDLLLGAGGSDPSGLYDFWDEHVSHYLIDSGRVLFAGALLWGTARTPAGLGSLSADKGAPARGWGAALATVVGGAVYGFVTFTAAVEGQTVPLMLPLFALLAAWSALAQRRAPAERGSARATVLAFYAAASWTGLVFFAIWGIWQRGFPEFTRAGILRMRHSVVLFATLAMAAHASLPTAARAADTGADSTRLTFRPYTIRALDGTTRPVEIGRLTVPETHAQPTGKSIRVVFLRIRSTSPAPAAPIVFLPGGPGYPGTLLARTPAYLRLFDALRERSDVLVLDQRGSGLSEPTLQCAARGSLPPDAFASEEKTAGALAGMVRPCVRLVRADGHAIEAYNTAESAEDLETLRRALGVERIRLLAVSYGTELALEMIRKHGDRVEAAVLAGTRGPDMAWRLPHVADQQLRRFSALVAASPRWEKDLPDFEGTVRRMLEGLAWKPASISITDAKTRRKVRVLVGPVGLQAILGSDMSDWTRAPLLPATIASLVRGDSTLFTRRVEELVNSTSEGISIMQIATDCASGASPERRSLVTRTAKAALLGNVKNMLVNAAFCDLVGSRDLGPAFREPITSSVRTLFITGAMDGITPPFQAEEVRWGFPEGVHLVVENGWHETLPFAEPQRVVQDFFAGQDLRGRSIALPPPNFLSIEVAKSVTGGR